MALSKQTNHSSRVATTALITPETSRKISMGASPKAMRFLIDRLTDMYPEPIVSSVREVISNAIDATMQMPEDLREPIEILSPGTFTPVFVVTDHGVGMSVEDVEDLFSQYGGSEKMDDFTQLGAYGLGAKAPLAYCNQFNVETTKDGITTRFTVSRESIGNTTEIYFSDRTGKAPGTSVSIPVKTGDEHKFNSALDNYRKFQADVPITLDGKLVEQTLDYGFFDTVELDADAELVGRVWVRNENFEDILTRYVTQGKSEPSIGFLLSGWIYKGRHSSYDHPDFLVELKPGVVDFSSSRDDITRNERYEALIKRLDDSLSTINERLLSKVMEYYKTIPNRDAWVLFNSMSLSAKGDKVTLDVSDRGYFRYTSRPPVSKSFKLKTEDFTTDTGFNPVKVALNQKPKSVFGKVFLTGDDGSNYDFRSVRKLTKPSTDIRSYKKTLNRFETTPNNSYGRRTYAMVSEEIRTSVESGQTVSLTDLYFGTGEGPPGHQSTLSTVIVTGVDVGFVDEFVKRRLTVARHLYPNRILIFASAAPSVEEQELVTSVFGVEFNLVTATEFRKKMEEAHKKALAERKAATPAERTLLVRTQYEFGDKIEKLSAARRYGPAEDVLVSEIIAEGNVLVGVRAEAIDRVIMGAINRGADFRNKKVYYSTDQNAWLAQHFTLLDDYENVFFSPSFVNNSKAGRKVLERQRRDSSFLLSEVKKIDLSEIIHLYLYENSFPDSQGPVPLWSNLKPHTEDPMMKRVYQRLAGAKKSPDWQNYYGKGSEMLDARLPQEEVRVLKTLVAEVVGLYQNYSSTFVQGLYNRLTHVTGEEAKGEVYDFLIERYAKYLEERVASVIAEEDAQVAAQADASEDGSSK